MKKMILILTAMLCVTSTYAFPNEATAQSALNRLFDLTQKEIKSSIQGNPFAYSVDLMEVEAGARYYEAKVDINEKAGYAGLTKEQQVKALINKIGLVKTTLLEDDKKLVEKTTVLCSVDSCNITSTAIVQKVVVTYTSASVETLEKYEITMGVIFVGNKLIIKTPENA